jgi:hypothetical protein
MPITKERLITVVTIADEAMAKAAEAADDMKRVAGELVSIAASLPPGPQVQQLIDAANILTASAGFIAISPEHSKIIGAEQQHYKLTASRAEKDRLYQLVRRADTDPKVAQRLAEMNIAPGTKVNRAGEHHLPKSYRAPAPLPPHLSEKARIMLEAAAPMIPQKYHPILGEYVPQPPAAFSDPTLPANFLENPIDDTSGNPVPLSPPKAGAVVPSLSPDMTCRELRLTGRYSEEELMAMCDDYRAPGA